MTTLFDDPEPTAASVPRQCSTCRFYVVRFGANARHPQGNCCWSPEKMPQVWREGRDGVLPASSVLAHYGTQCETWEEAKGEAA